MVWLRPQSKFNPSARNTLMTKVVDVKVGWLSASSIVFSPSLSEYPCPLLPWSSCVFFWHSPPRWNTNCRVFCDHIALLGNIIETAGIWGVHVYHQIRKITGNIALWRASIGVSGRGVMKKSQAGQDLSHRSPVALSASSESPVCLLPVLSCLQLTQGKLTQHRFAALRYLTGPEVVNWQCWCSFMGNFLST